MIARHRVSRILALSFLTTVFSVGVLQAQASAEPLWNLDIHHDQTNFPPGGTAELAFDIRNIGSTPSSGTIKLHVALPPGITRNSYYLDLGTIKGTSTEWECPGAPGDSSFTCTTTTPIGATIETSDARNLLLTVNVAADANPESVVTADISGGGAPEAPPAADCPEGVGACATEHVHVSEELAPFGIAEDSWIADSFRSCSR